MNALFIKGIFHFKNYSFRLFKKTFEKRRTPIGKLDNCCIFVSVFHRILDFKNGAGFLSWPHFFCTISNEFFSQYALNQPLK
jgi:hypothetical protein